MIEPTKVSVRNVPTKWRKAMELGLGQYRVIGELADGQAYEANWRDLENQTPGLQISRIYELTGESLLSQEH